MITHYIILSSSYSRGTRIALHYLLDESNYDELKDVVSTIVNKCGKDVSISTHFIQTDSTSWESVCIKDHYFKGIEVIDSIDKFIKLIQKDRVLNGFDVAKYILCKIKCTHLKLEKLVYLCFADYLCKYDEELYKDKIFSYKYGPVVKSVYEKYKKYGYKEIEQEDELLQLSNEFEMPSRSRIMFAESGLKKINSIDETLRKYSKCSAAKLVELTHRENTPWAKSGKGQNVDEIIDNDSIKKYHCNETIC